MIAVATTADDERDRGADRLAVARRRATRDAAEQQAEHERDDEQRQERDDHQQQDSPRSGRDTSSKRAAERAEDADPLEQQRRQRQRPERRRATMPGMMSRIEPDARSARRDDREPSRRGGLGQRRSAASATRGPGRGPGSASRDRLEAGGDRGRTRSSTRAARHDEHAPRLAGARSGASSGCLARVEVELLGRDRRARRARADDVERHGEHQRRSATSVRQWRPKILKRDVEDLADAQRPQRRAVVATAAKVPAGRAVYAQPPAMAGRMTSVSDSPTEVSEAVEDAHVLVVEVDVDVAVQLTRRRRRAATASRGAARRARAGRAPTSSPAAWTSFSPPTDGRSTGGILIVAIASRHPSPRRRRTPRSRGRRPSRRRRSPTGRSSRSGTPGRGGP